MHAYVKQHVAGLRCNAPVPPTKHSFKIFAMSQLHTVLCFMQMSYELLYSLNEGMEMLLTGPDTNPTTLATAITALQSSLASLDTTNDTVTILSDVMVRPPPASPSILNSAFHVSFAVTSLLCVPSCPNRRSACFPT